MKENLQREILTAEPDENADKNKLTEIKGRVTDIVNVHLAASIAKNALEEV